MKKFLGLTVAILIFVVQVGCGNSTANSENVNENASSSNTNLQDENQISTSADKNDTIAEQIKLIADNFDSWKIGDETDFGAYAVTDIDNNGRLEIISSSCRGTGLFSNNNVWQVNENMDGLEKCNQNINEEDSQPDLISYDNVDAYYDSQKNIYYLILQDMSRNGMAEYYENKRAWSLQGNEIKQNYLAHKTTVYTDEENAQITCKDANDNPITQEEYKNIADKVYSGLKKLSVKINWVNTQDLADKDKLYDALYDSYKNFSIK